MDDLQRVDCFEKLHRHLLRHEPHLQKMYRAAIEYWQRLVVRPGLTGFAQTRMGREPSWAEKLAHDLEYVADRSVTLYLRVVGATLVRVCRQSARGVLDLVLGRAG